MEERNKKEVKIKDTTKDIFKVRHRGNSSLFEVYSETGGVIPSILSGEYTSEKYAKLAIEQYLIKRNK